MEPQEQTNFHRWRSYMDGFVSPDSYIDWGFYYLIAASLQRRVWIGPDHSRLFPNMYPILVGEPGIGKGLVIKQVAELLRYHKLPDPNATNLNNNKNIVSDVDRAAMEEIAKADYEAAKEYEGTSSVEKRESKNKIYEKPLLIPVAADATTYEALVRSMSKSIRRINYKEFDAKLNKDIMKIYTHSSLCFCLEEISSLFRKRTEDVVHFLIQAYDCGDYTYDTKTQGKDRVRKCCLNLFGGTTPGFMQTTFDDQLLTEGFASRCIFIFAAKNRKSSIWIPELSKEQKEAYNCLLLHIEKLSHLYGRVLLSKETEDFLEEWWKTSQENKSNTSIRLVPYYARKQIHVIKLAMALHFGESTDMYIGKWAFERAISILNNEEKNMHLALGLDSDNPLANPARKIVRTLKASGKKTRKELLAEFWHSLPNGMSDIDSILEYLTAMNEVVSMEMDHPVTKQQTTYYIAR